MTSFTLVTAPKDRHGPTVGSVRAATPLRVEPVAVPAAEYDDEAVASAKRAAAEVTRLVRRERLRGIVTVVLPPLLGLALFVGIWALIAQTSPQLPGPNKVYRSAV